MPEHPEQEIIAGCLQQQRYWQEHLHRKYYGVLLKLCARYTHNMEDAEQLVQDSFLRIFLKIGTYNNTGSFEGWMKQVAVHICLDFLRSKAGKWQTAFPLSAAVIDSTQGDAVQDGIQQMAFKDLLAIIQSLPDASRVVFNLFVFEGYTHRQIAQELGISEGTSSWHVHQARKVLQEKITLLNLQHVSYAGK